MSGEWKLRPCAGAGGSFVSLPSVAVRLDADVDAADTGVEREKDAGIGAGSTGRNIGSDASEMLAFSRSNAVGLGAG